MPVLFYCVITKLVPSNSSVGERQGVYRTLGCKLDTKMETESTDICAALQSEREENHL